MFCVTFLTILSCSKEESIEKLKLNENGVLEFENRNHLSKFLDLAFSDSKNGTNELSNYVPVEFNSYAHELETINFDEIVNKDTYEKHSELLIIDEVKNELTERVKPKLIQKFISKFREIVVADSIFVFDYNDVYVGQVKDYDFKRHNFNNLDNFPIKSRLENKRWNVGTCENEFQDKRRVRGEIETTNTYLYNEVRVYVKMHKKTLWWVYTTAANLNSYGTVIAINDIPGYTSGGSYTISCSNCSNATEVLAYSTIGTWCAYGTTNNEGRLSTSSPYYDCIVNVTYFEGCVQ